MIKKNVLLVANTASMIKLFNMRNIRILTNLGCKVVVATNFSQPGTISQAEAESLQNDLKELHVDFYQIDFKRGLGSFRSNHHCFLQLCSVIEEEEINFIHTHAPLSSVIARLAAHKMGIKCMYTSHGFQFYSHAPLKNWLLYYPVEYWLSRYTDAIITINSDDYRFATKMKSEHVFYIHGVGTDVIGAHQLLRTKGPQIRVKTRNKFGLQSDDFMLLSIGELTKRKNHETVIRALAELNDHHIKYFIAGIGPEKQHLLTLIRQLGLQEQVKLLGFQHNVTDLYLAADLNCFISIREGLGMGGLEGVTLGLYILATSYTGSKDYVSVPQTGILINHPMNVNEVSNGIRTARDDHRVAHPDYGFLEYFDFRNIDLQMIKIYIRELSAIN